MLLKKNKINKTCLRCISSRLQQGIFSRFEIQKRYVRARDHKDVEKSDIPGIDGTKSRNFVLLSNQT